MKLYIRRIFILSIVSYFAYIYFFSSNNVKMTKPLTTVNSLNQVIVIGSGLAGLSATATLLSHGVKVQLMEMDPKIGGNSIKASSGINGSPTRFQDATIGDSKDLFMKDTLRSAGEMYIKSDTKTKDCRSDLINTLTSNSKDAVDWLVEKFNVDLSVVARLGGHSKPRTHRGSGKIPPGAAIVMGLSNYIKQMESSLININTNCQVTKILTDPTDQNFITGVEYLNKEDKTTSTILGPVIIAVGGYAGDKDGLLTKFRPDLSKYPSTNSPKQGSLSLLMDLGAELIDIDQVQIHPTGFIDPENEYSPVKFLAAEALRGEGGILLNTKGERFVNEVMQRDQVTKSIHDHITKLENQGIEQWETYMVLDEGAASSMQNSIDFYCFKKLLKKTTLGELSTDLPNLKKTLVDYSNYATQSTNSIDPLGRTHFGHWDLKPDQITDSTVLYIGRITPVTHFTMGGAKFNPQAQIIESSSQSPFTNIWGAGEVTGGLHGSNRLGGSSLLECVVFGRIAADQVLKKYGFDKFTT